MPLQPIATRIIELTSITFNDGSVKYIDALGHIFYNTSLSSLSTLSSLSSLSLNNRGDKGEGIGIKNNDDYSGSGSGIDGGHSVWNALAESSEVIRGGLLWDEVLLYICICIALIILGGVANGLNVSLLAIDPLKIRLMESSTAKVDQKLVKKIKPLIRDQHFLITTLVIASASAMEALPIFLDRMVASWLSIIVAVTFVLIFGEILPQVLLTRNPMRTAERFAWLVRGLEILFFPVCYPLSLLLNWLFPREHAVLFSRYEIQALFQLISKDATYSETRKQFHRDELRFLDGALKLKTCLVTDHMISWGNVCRFSCDLILDKAGLQAIWSCGFSRIPVYNKHSTDIIGVCLVKDLIRVDPNKNLRLELFARHHLPVVLKPDINMIHALNIFQDKKTHFALVTPDAEIVDACLAEKRPIPENTQILGCITLEDIMEELIQEEIEDEYDTQKVQDLDDAKHNLEQVLPETTYNAILSRLRNDTERNAHRRQKHMRGPVQEQGLIMGEMPRSLSTGSHRIKLNEKDNRRAEIHRALIEDLDDSENGFLETDKQHADSHPLELNLLRRGSNTYHGQSEDVAGHLKVPDREDSSTSAATT